MYRNLGGGGGERMQTAIHLVMVFIFARVTRKNRSFCDVPQQVLSEVVVSDINNKKKEP